MPKKDISPIQNGHNCHAVFEQNKQELQSSNYFHHLTFFFDYHSSQDIRSPKLPERQNKEFICDPISVCYTNSYVESYLRKLQAALN
jgi:hypothetical protein